MTLNDKQTRLFGAIPADRIEHAVRFEASGGGDGNLGVRQQKIIGRQPASAFVTALCFCHGLGDAACFGLASKARAVLV